MKVKKVSKLGNKFKKYVYQKEEPKRQYKKKDVKPDENYSVVDADNESFNDSENKFNEVV